MATGLVGTSTVTNAATGTQSGSTLTYTCPASGVRYAVVTIAVGTSASAANGGITGSACSVVSTAGAISSSAVGVAITGSAPTAAAATSSATSTQYSVVLGPSQSISVTPSVVAAGVTTYLAGSGTASAVMSVLEVV